MLTIMNFELLEVYVLNNVTCSEVLYSVSLSSSVTYHCEAGDSL
jgi:hypothetical protein